MDQTCGDADRIGFLLYQGAEKARAESPVSSINFDGQIPAVIFSDMATDPKDIRLTNEHRELIAKFADEVGESWSRVLDGLLQSLGVNQDQLFWLKAQEATLAKVWDNESDSIFDEM